MDLAKKIESLRKQKGMSQEVLADKLQVSRQAVFKWECGESTPSISKLKELAVLFEVSLDYLLMDQNDVPANKQPQAVQAKYRKVFKNLIGLNLEVDVAIQNGYYTGDKHEHPELVTLFFERNKFALSKIKYSTKINFCHDSNSAVLIDTENNTFSLYLQTAERFICPFENLISITLTDAGPRTVYNSQSISGGMVGINGGAGVMFGENNSFSKGVSAIYFMEIKYHTHEGKIETYKFSMRGYRNHLLFVKDYSDSFSYNFYVDGICNQIKNSFIKIKETIETCIKEAGHKTNLKEIDVDAKNNLIADANKIYDPVIQEHERIEQKSEKKADIMVFVLKVVLPIILLIGAIVIIVVVLNK